MNNIYYNGKFIKRSELVISIENRGLRYGDSFFETIRCFHGNPLFWEDHYFRIAGSFCVLKMLPPHDFEMENLCSIIQKLLLKNNLDSCSARVRITFFRSDGGYYSPIDNNVHFFIESYKLSNQKYKLNIEGLNTELYTDNILSKHDLGNIKTNNKLVNILASIYAKENNFDDCLLINNDKNIVESTSGNVFVLKNNIIKTPPLEDGCVDGIIRRILLKQGNLHVEESSISFLDIFNAEEVFFTNVICGVKWVSKIKNRTYTSTFSHSILKLLNNKYLI